jgi:hypothetical protein
MSIQPKSTTYTIPDDPSWLGSAHGVDATDTVTLDVSTFTAGTHYPNGFLPGGLALGKITASGKYGPYSDAAVDGRTALAGFLVFPRLVNGQTAVVGALLTHGKVREARLPIAIDANAKVDVAGRIQFV